MELVQGWSHYIFIKAFVLRLVMFLWPLKINAFIFVQLFKRWLKWEVLDRILAAFFFPPWTAKFACIAAATKWARACQNQPNPNDPLAQQRLTQIGLYMRTIWSEPLLCAKWVAKDPSLLHADSKDWLDWCPHWSVFAGSVGFCWFCCALSQMIIIWAVKHKTSKIWHCCTCPTDCQCSKLLIYYKNFKQ